MNPQENKSRYSLTLFKFLIVISASHRSCQREKGRILYSGTDINWQMNTFIWTAAKYSRVQK